MSKIKLVGHTRNQRGMWAGVIGLVGNMVIFASKIFVGVASGSIAIISDSINNLLDSTSSVIAIFSFRVGGKRKDATHPNGHGRVEYLAALCVAIVIVLTAIVLGFFSIQRIVNPTPVEGGVAMVAVVVITMVGKGLLGVYYFWENRKVKSQVLKAAGLDSIGDTVATAVALVALIFSPMTDFPIDGIAGVVVSLFILMIGLQSFFQSSHLIIGYRPEKKLRSKVRQEILSADSFTSIRKMTFHDYGPTMRDAVVMVRLKRGVRREKVEADIDKVKHKLKLEYGVALTLYWAP